MIVLVDTSVWSLGLRRRRRDLNRVERVPYFAWEELLVRGRAAIIGPVRQEVLSGIVSLTEFEELRQRLAVIGDLEITTSIFVQAAEFFNVCRRSGITPEAVDMTICAAAHEHSVPIFTTDPDFPRYAKHLPISLYGTGAQMKVHT
jgi:predicted nucleic acid-binding protein